MAEFDGVIAEAQAFVRRARSVTLETLLDEADSVAEEFQHFKIRTESAKGFWIKMNGWDSLSKADLATLARQKGVQIRAAEGKAAFLVAVVGAHWNMLDVAGAYEEAFEESERIRKWAKHLREIPERLQELIDNGEKAYQEWLASQSKGLHESVSYIRMHALPLMEFEWAVRNARQALRKFEKGEPAAKVVLDLFHQVELAIMGVIPTNLSASGVGLEHMAHIGGAKILTRTLERVVPEEAKAYVATAYLRL